MKFETFGNARYTVKALPATGYYYVIDKTQKLRTELFDITSKECLHRYKMFKTFWKGRSGILDGAAVKLEYPITYTEETL